MKSNQIKHSFAQISRLRQSVFNNSMLLAFALLLPVVFAASCAESSSEKAERVGGVTAQQIIENPSAYVGKTVTVSGDVEEIHSPRAFNMDSGASVGELLVVGREPFPNIAGADNRAYVINDVATVTGKIELLDAAKMKDEIGWDLDPNIFGKYGGKPVLVVQKASFSAGNGKTATTTNGVSNLNQSGMDKNGSGTMTANNGSGAMANGNPNQTGGGNEVTDFTMLVTNPNLQSLVGQRVNLNNIKVQSVVGDRTFYVGPSASQRVFVVLDEIKTPNTPIEGKYDITAGQTINSLSGVVEKMPSVEEAKQRFGKLMDAAELNQLKNQQILVHTSAANVKK